MNFGTKRRWAFVAGAAALAALIGCGAVAEEKKIERKKIVVKDGEGPAKVWVFEGDGDDAGPGGSWLGLGVREETKLPEGGARVTAVVDDSPAAKAGLKEGDVIVGFDGDVIRGPAKLTEKIHEAKPGQSVKLDVVRDGSRRTVTAEIGERKGGVRIFAPGFEGGDMSEEQRKALEESLRDLDEKMPELQKKLSELDRMRMPRAFKFRGPGAFAFTVGGPRLGVELVETTPELRVHLGGKEDAGVLVGKVLPESAAEKAGLEVGDLIVRAGGETIEDAGDLVEAVHDGAGKTIDVEVVRDGRTLTIKAAIPEAKEEDEPHGPRAHRALAPLEPFSAVAADAL